MTTMATILRPKKLLLGDHEALEVGSVNHAIVNLELCESVLAFLCGELVAECHEGLPEHLGVDLAVHLESLEGFEDDIIVVDPPAILSAKRRTILVKLTGAVVSSSIACASPALTGFPALVKACTRSS